MTPPETRYARSGDIRIAYQTIGSGPFDLVFVPGFASNVDATWELPSWARFYSRLASFSRLILFDKRGTGLSDRSAGIATLEERMDDVRAVMDAAGSERAALFGVSEGGPMSLLFAATYPQRVRALILYGTYAHSRHLASEDGFRKRIELIDQTWGSGQYVTRFVPSQASNEAAQRFMARLERQGASPSAAIAISRMNRGIDARHVLSVIRVPTLVIHRAEDSAAPKDLWRFIADQIAGSKYIELPGTDHWPLYERTVSDRIVDEVEEFLTGSRSSEVDVDRVLATVMFTDIVDSTKRAAELGDRQWRALLDRYDEVVRHQIARFRGHEVKNLGDGFMATFDGPARAVRCAAAISESVRPFGIAIRSGLPTGEIELKRGDIAGIAVHIAARVAAEAGA